MQAAVWLPLTEYALRSGISISTLRRKIKTHTIEYKMDDGRYLIRCDDMELADPAPITKTTTAFVSSDAATAPAAIDSLRAEIKQQLDESALRWKALEARVAGLAKKMDIYSEQVSELKMLVKIFEEKLDRREV